MTIELVIASKNKEKQLVIQQIAKKMGIFTYLHTDLLVNDRDIRETGNSYFENAYIKASYVYEKTNIPSIADDQGMEISFLGGKPGVYTHRWGNLYLQDSELLSRTMTFVSGLPMDKRNCDFVGCGVLVYSQNRYFTCLQKDSGYLLTQPRGPVILGHPLSSILFFPEFSKTLAELKLDGFESKDYRIYTSLIKDFLSLYPNS